MGADVRRIFVFLEGKTVTPNFVDQITCGPKSEFQISEILGPHVIWARVHNR
jgi:hypothetical protein